MRRAVTALAAAALAVGMLSTPAHAHEGTDSQFEVGWDDPTTASRPITEPSTESCKVDIVDHQYSDDSVHSSDYAPPEECAGEWSKVVLNLEGSAQGSQAERMGTVAIDGVPIFKTSTPKPSAEGIEWEAEKDVTPYATMLRSGGDVTSAVAPIGDNDANVTGVLALKVSLTFYRVDDDHPAPDAADTVTGLSEKESADGARISVPRNSQRLFVDVYATAQGDACEQEWYARPMQDSGRGCGAADGSYREIQVLVDGEIVGLAAPYPQLSASAFGNQYLWSTLPAPRTFDVQPTTVDLTPYLAVLNDGEKHDIAVKVAGSSGKDYGWSAPAALRSWQDEDSEVVTGGILMSRVSDSLNNQTTSNTPSNDSSEIHGSREHSVSGWLSTSSGEIMTTIERSIANTSTHTWSKDKESESLDSRWTDVETKTVTTDGGNTSTRTVDSVYELDGTTTAAEGRSTSDVSVSDAATVEFADQHGTTNQYTRTHTYEGDASWNLDVPVLERAAKGKSKQRYTLGGEWACYDRSLETVDGKVTKETDHCGRVKR